MGRSSEVIFPKGSVIDTSGLSVFSGTPFLLVPFWPSDDGTPSSQVQPALRAVNAIFSGKISLPELRTCPQESDFCRRVGTLDQATSDSHHHPLAKFCRKLYQHDSFQALTILSTLEYILENMESAKVNSPQDWKNVLGDTNDPSSQLQCLNGSDDEDETLLVEAWPFLQDVIPWECFVKLYQLIQSKLHMITIPHPLMEYLKQQILFLEQDGFDQVTNLAVAQGWIHCTTQNRLELSKLLEDYILLCPPLRVGIILQDPCQATSRAKSRATDDLSISLAQSCLPSTCLELVQAEPKACIECNLVALYDMDSTEAVELTISTQPPSKHCKCPECVYKSNPSKYVSSMTLQDVSIAQRLAHRLFQQQDLDDAKRLYRRCYDLVTASSTERDANAAELWHAMGAIELTRHRFIEAQNHWKDGSRYSKSNDGIALQLEKQEAYGYSEALPTCNTGVAVYETTIPRKLFVTRGAISTIDCNKVIDWAHQAASTNGWTTSRHYAVPTTDVPVHQHPALLKWFRSWMEGTIHSLLQDQFQTHQRFYVHDAFVARYTADSTSRYLPLHYDESTHSFVLALNGPDNDETTPQKSRSETNCSHSEFEGGGTYVWQGNQTVCPPRGGLVSFRGNQLLHGGMLVTKGVRYILAVFLYLDHDTTEPEGDTPLPPTKKSRIASVGASQGFSFGFF